jgi:Coenzyme PQQ synthesis protein D (PqqD)
VARDVLNAVPVAAADTSLQALPRGGVLLVRRLPAKPGLFGGLVQRLRLERELRYELDAVGACFWAHVDGRRRLSDIQVALCQRFSLEPQDARRAIVEFTASLMRRHLLALRPEET